MHPFTHSFTHRQTPYGKAAVCIRDLIQEIWPALWEEQLFGGEGTPGHSNTFPMGLLPVVPV